MKHSLLSLAALAPLVGAGAAVFAQQTEVTRATGTLNEFSDFFGRAVAIHGDVALVSEPGSNFTTVGGGGVLVFERRAGRWERTSRLTPTPFDRLLHIGLSVAIHGDTAIAGTFFDDKYALGAGNAFVFERSGEDWNQVAELGLVGLKRKDRFGANVAIWKDTLVVSAHGDDTQGPDFGAVYVFERINGNWVKAAKLFGTQAVEGGKILGHSLDLHESTIVAGTWSSAYVFEKVGGQWETAARLAPPNPASEDDYGAAVAVWGDTIAVSDPVDQEPDSIRPGRVFIYKRGVAGDWKFKQILKASDPYSDAKDNGKFGSSLALYEDKLLVGSRRWGTPGFPGKGKSYVFERDEFGLWQETRQLVASDPGPSANFGNAVALSDQIALTGAFAAKVNGIGAGAAYFHDLGQAETYRPGEPNSEGAEAMLHAYGSRRVSLNRLTLRADLLPAGEPTLFLTSPTTGFVPHPGGGNGTLWLGAPLARLHAAPVVADSYGSASLKLDLTSIPLDPPVSIQPGQTWYFQAWYRDQDPGPTSNFTEAVGMTFD
jgi:FG-GAP repeat